MTGAGSGCGVVVAGSLAQRPGFGGHTWVFLQYLLGFKALGCEVTFLDRIDPDMAVDCDGRRCPAGQSENFRYLASVMDGFGLGGGYGVACEGGRRWLGLSRAEAVDRVRRSQVFINVMGFIDDPEILGAARRKVFLDIDPGFGQMWKQLGLADIFKGHDVFATVGENIGKDECCIPEAGLAWIPTRPPVVLEQWPVAAPGEGGFVAIGSWRGPFAPVEYSGRSFGLRVHEFRKFFDLPARAGEPFTLALDIDAAETADLRRLASNGWKLEDPALRTGDPWRYRRRIQDSGAEFMVAKGMYIESRSGWFSDRSACFLASGKPVLAQDSGMSDNYPTGRGLLCFSDSGEAAEAAREVAAAYPSHARAARDLAEEYFDSATVLGDLLGRATE